MRLPESQRQGEGPEGYLHVAGELSLLWRGVVVREVPSKSKREKGNSVYRTGFKGQRTQRERNSSRGHSMGYDLQASRLGGPSGENQREPRKVMCASQMSWYPTAAFLGH